MSINATKDVITQFITDVWNANKLDVLDELLDPAYYDYTYTLCASSSLTEELDGQVSQS